MSNHGIYAAACARMADEALGPLASNPVRDDLSPAPQPAALEDLLRQIVSQACLLTGADGAALALLSEEGIVCRASIGRAPAVGSPLLPGSGLSGECFRLRQVVSCDDAENDSRVDVRVRQQLQLRSILIAPILMEGSSGGVLQVLSTQAFAFNAWHIAILERLVGLVGKFLAADTSAQGVMPLAEPPGGLPSRRPILPTGSAIELEAPEAQTDQPVPGELVGAAGQNAEVTRVAPGQDILRGSIAEAKKDSRSNLRRYGTLVGVLGLLATMLFWVMIRLPQPSRTVQHAGSPHQAQSTPMPAQLSLPSQPETIEGVRKEGESLPTRRVLLVHGAGAGTCSTPPEPAIAVTPMPAVKSDSETTLGKNPEPSVRALPPSPVALGGATATAVLDALSTAPVVIAPPSPPRVSESVVPGQPISQPQPVYPRAALRARVEGTVVLTATIGTDGRVKKVQVVKGDPHLVSAVLRAVKKWRYQSSYLNGVPVEIESTITVNFERQ